MVALRRIFLSVGLLSILPSILAPIGDARVEYAPEVPRGPVCVVMRGATGACDEGPKVELGGRVAPKPTAGARLPVSLALFARIHNHRYQGAGVDPVESITFALDRGAYLDFGGIPGCYSAVAEHRRGCRRAIVGSGAVEFLIQSGDIGEPLPVHAKLVIYKASSSNDETLLRAQVRPASPRVPKTLNVKVARSGKEFFATRLKVAVPKFDEGYGALTSLHLLLRKNLPSEDGRVSPLVARCSNGRSTVAAEARFRDGIVTAMETASRCGGGRQDLARSR